MGITRNDPALEARFILNMNGIIFTRVPSDVAVVGMDDTDIAGMWSPESTTVRQPFRDMFRKAGEPIGTPGLNISSGIENGWRRYDRA